MGNLIIEEFVTAQRTIAVIEPTCLEDNSVSLEARFIHVYLMTRSIDWEVDIKEVVDVVGKSERFVLKCLGELEEKGYLRREKRRANGKYGTPIYHILTRQG